MLENLFSSPTIGALERTLNFTEQRHRLILENLANVSTPGYVQQDVSVAEFQKSLADALDKTRQGFNVPLQPDDTTTIGFDGTSVSLKPVAAANAQPFHDRGARSMEELMGQLADNAEAHNMAASFLKNKYDGLQRAISMKV